MEEAVERQFNIEEEEKRLDQENEGKFYEDDILIYRAHRGLADELRVAVANCPQKGEEYDHAVFILEVFDYALDKLRHQSTKLLDSRVREKNKLLAITDRSIPSAFNDNLYDTFEEVKAKAEA